MKRIITLILFVLMFSGCSKLGGSLNGTRWVCGLAEGKIGAIEFSGLSSAICYTTDEYALLMRDRIDGTYSRKGDDLYFSDGLYFSFGALSENVKYCLMGATIISDNALDVTIRYITYYNQAGSFEVYRFHKVN